MDFASANINIKLNIKTDEKELATRGKILQKSYLEFIRKNKKENKK
jgi:hypothetical protein